MGLLFFTVLALFDPSGVGIVIASIAPMLILVSGFFYAEASLFITAVFVLFFRFALALLSPELGEVPLYETLITASKALEILVTIGLVLSASQGYLAPTSRTCFDVIASIKGKR